MKVQQPLLMEAPLKEKSLTGKYVEIALVVALYWIVSISMVFINKHILSDKSVNFDAPLFITFYQCLCTIIFCLICNFIGHVKPSFVRWLGFPKLHLRPAIIRKVFPLSIVFVGMITMNNLCLKYVGVAFYFVGRSLTTVFNVILTYLILKEITSAKAILCCIIIIIGFIVGVDQESLQGSLTITGIFFGVAASFFVSLNSIFTKSILPVVDGNIWMLNFYNNVNALILFTILITISGELPVIYDYEHLTSLQFWSMMTVSGLLAVSIGFVTGLQIKVTSPLTHNISGTAKACAQTVLACVWYNEEKSVIWWFSNLLVIFGSAAYTRVKQLEMRWKHAKEMRQTTEP